MNKQALMGLLCLFSLSIFAQNADYALYIGTYTRKTSEGIYVYRFNAKTGELTPLSITKQIANPSFLAISPNKRFLYALEGQNGDSVRAFMIDKTSGQLTTINSQQTSGKGAVHLQVDKTNKWLILGSYRSGNLNVFPIKPDGSLEKTSQIIQHVGSSIDTARQKQAYVHSINISPNNRDVFVPDLGMDKIMAYTLNEETGQLSVNTAADAPTKPGSGPRHFTFHPNGKLAYVIQEMGALITGFHYINGILTPFQTISTLPDDYKGLKWSADIHISPDDKFLYGSNRAHESLAIFSIHKKTGQLTLVGYEQVRGHTPRNFAIDPTGNFILVANQDSDNITVFKRNKKTGKLTFTGKEISISSPVCLIFYKL